METDDYARQDSERPNVDPYALTEDERLDDPRHGQADA